MIHHHLSQLETDLQGWLTQELGLTAEYAQELIHLGSIYVNHERARQNMPIKLADYIRTHAQPRRFPVQSIDWRSQIFAETDDYVVVNKPHGIPTHPTVDNWQENTTKEISRLIGCETFVTHRLDVATSGLLVLAKTKHFQRQFNFALRDGLVHKEYFAMVRTAPVERGLVRHFMEPSSFLPRIVSRERNPETQSQWQECLLEILRVFPFEENYLVHIRLLTGRTHQIRAQLSDLGYPILGDKLYGGEEPWYGIEKIGLIAGKLSFSLPESPEQVLRFSLPFAESFDQG